MHKDIKELLVALTAGPTPHLALKAARADGSLARLLPELDALYGVPQTEEHHPEVDTGIHCEMVMEVAALLSNRPRARFAALMHDLGKGVTPQEEWPKHHKHEANGIPLVEQVCDRAEVPDDWRRIGMLTSKYHLEGHKAMNLRPGTLVKFFQETGFLDDSTMFEDFLLACEADKRGRGGMLDSDYPQGQFLAKAMEVVRHALPLKANLPDDEALYVGRIRDLKRYMVGLKRPTAEMV